MFSKRKKKDSKAEDTASETKAVPDAEEEKDPFAPKTEEELNAELEDLKDMVQGEIDKMMENNPEADWKEVVCAAAEEKRLGIKPQKEELCEVCGENPVVEGTSYCEDCLHNMTHYPFSWWHFLIPIISLMFAALAVVMVIHSWSIFSGTAGAQRLAGQKKLFSAMTRYSTLNADIKENGGKYGSRYLKNQVKLYNEIGVQEFSDLKNFIDTYYTGTDLQKPWNLYASKTKAKIDAYSGIYEYFNTAASEATDFNSFVKAFDKAIAGKNVNTAYADYYKYYACLIYSQDVTAQKEYIDGIAAQGTEYASLYLPLYAELSLNEHEYDQAISYANQMRSHNAEDTYLYVYRAIAYRMKGDLARSTASINEGLKLGDNSTSPSLNYQMSIIYLISGQYRLAQSYAETAYKNADTANTYQSAANMYALTAKLRAQQYKEAKKTAQYSDQNDIYVSVKQTLESDGFEISPDIMAIVKGKKTAKDVFMKGNGDFTW